MNIFEASNDPFYPIIRMLLCDGMDAGKVLMIALGCEEMATDFEKEIEKGFSLDLEWEPERWDFLEYCLEQESSNLQTLIFNWSGYLLLESMKGENERNFDRLIRIGADLSVSDYFGRTPLLAAIDRFPLSVDYLLEKRECIWEPDLGEIRVDDNGSTPLHYMIRKASNSDLIERFIQLAGPKCCLAKDNIGLTPIDEANNLGDARIIRLLSKYSPTESFLSLAYA